jgi:hypothetical protein
MPHATRPLAALFALVAATPLILACSGEPDPTGLPEPLARHNAAAAPPAAAAPTAPVRPPTRIDTCEQLAISAAVHPPDAAILLELCPGTATTNPAILRHALLMADSPAAAAALAPRLAAAPDLAGIAHASSPSTAPTCPGPPSSSPTPSAPTVSPVTDAVLAAVQLAIVQQTESGLSQDQRTRATAYLARVHHEALLQLGLDLGPGGEPLPPFARVLAGRFLHFGRELCRMYWQRRVAGLEALFASTEAQLLRTRPRPRAHPAPRRRRPPRRRASAQPSPPARQRRRRAPRQAEATPPPRPPTCSRCPTSSTACSTTASSSW